MRVAQEQVASRDPALAAAQRPERDAAPVLPTPRRQLDPLGRLHELEAGAPDDPIEGREVGLPPPRARTRAVAGLQLAGQAARWALLAPAALVAPARFADRRDAARWWMTLHRTGLERRGELEAHR